MKDTKKMTSDELLSDDNLLELLRCTPRKAAELEQAMRKQAERLHIKDEFIQALRRARLTQCAETIGGYTPNEEFIQQCISSFEPYSRSKVNDILDMVFQMREEIKQPYIDFISTIASECKVLTHFKEQLHSFSRNTDQDYISEKLDRDGSIKQFVVIPKLARRIQTDFTFLRVAGSIADGASGRRYIYTDGVYRHNTDNELKGIIKSYIPEYIQNSRDIDEVFKLVSYEPFRTVKYDELNADAEHINFRNGFFSINTMKLNEHTHLIPYTIQLNAEYDEKATECPVFDDFIKTLTDNNKDMQRLILELMGIAISNINASEKIKAGVFMTGDGDCGKSVIKKLLIDIIGAENCDTSNLSDYEGRFGTSSLFGKRLAGANDMSFQKVKEISRFKELTGSDSIRAEFKGGAVFNFKFRGLFWFCANKLPKFGGDTGDWVYNRFIIIKCRNVIPKEKQDTELINKLLSEKSAIINKALAALRKFIERGYKLTMPEEVLKERELYKSYNSPIIQFFKECCEQRADTYNCTLKAVLHRVFNQWCIDNNVHSKYTTEKIEEEASTYFKLEKAVKKIHGTRYYTFALTKEAKEEYGVYDTV